MRACKRCQPNGQGIAARRAELVAGACRIIDNAEEPPDLITLAAAVGVSRFHLHRMFKETGITPKSYADASRARPALGRELIALVGDFNKGPKAGPPPEHPTLEALFDPGNGLVDAYGLDVFDVGPRPGTFAGCG